MMILNLETIWNVLLLLTVSYFGFLLSVVFLYLPIIAGWETTLTQTKSRGWWFLSQFALSPILILMGIVLWNQLYLWNSQVVLSWFGHVIFGNFQLKMSYLIGLTAIVFLAILAPVLFHVNKESFDFMLIVAHFIFWETLLFWSNTILVTVILVEILSTLILLLLVNSSFASFYFFSNLNLSMHAYFNQSQPNSLVQALVILFWISLLISLNLFLFLILFYFQFSTTDWFLLEILFVWMTDTDTSTVTSLLFIWFSFLSSLFLKCGLVPFYFWKPTFFRNASLFFLFFYVTFFYFILLLFLITFLTAFVGEFFFFFNVCNILIIGVGFICLLFLLLEAYHIRTFLALSSILNTLLILIAVSGLNEHVLL